MHAAATEQKLQNNAFIGVTNERVYTYTYVAKNSSGSDSLVNAFLSCSSKRPFNAVVVGAAVVVTPE